MKSLLHYTIFKRKLKAISVSFFLLILASVAAQSQTYQPVAVTGFNHDIVANGSLSPINSTTRQVDGQPDGTNDGNVLYAKGYYCFAEYGLGLPTNGFFTSANNSLINYQLASYDANNALYIPTVNAGGVLQFNTARKYNDLSVLAFSTEGGSAMSVVLNFTDGSSSSPYSFSVHDWFYGFPYAISGLGRINRGDYCLTDQGSYSSNPMMYDNVLHLNAGDRQKMVQSITVTNTGAVGTSGRIVVMAVSGNELGIGENSPLSFDNISATSETCANANNGTITLNYSGGVAPYSIYITGFSHSFNLTGITATTFTATGLAPDNYYDVLIRDSNGDEYSKPIIVGAGVPLPDPIIINTTGKTSVCPGDYTTLAAYASGKSLQFTDGSYVEASSTPAISLTNALTVEAWVKTDYPGATQYIVSKGNKDMMVGQYGLLINNGKFQFHLFDGVHQGVTGTTDIQPGVWYHVAGTWDGTTTTIYVNGVAEGSSNFTGTLTANNEPLQIGRLGFLYAENWWIQYQFYGEIDELRIWNRSRTEAEIQTNNRRTLAADPSLVAYYNFDLGGGNSVPDLAHGNNGFLSHDLANYPGSTDPNWVNSAAYNYASYQWSNGQSSFMELTDFTVTEAGTYTVTVTDAYGCTASSAPVIISNGAPIAYTTVGGGVHCAGTTASPIVLTTSEIGVTYYLNSTNSESSLQTLAGTGSMLIFTDQGDFLPGSYTIVGIKDATGCITNMNGAATISENPLPTANIVVSNSSCTGTQGTVTVNPLTGTAPFMYSFDGGMNYQSANTSSLPNGTHSVYMTDINNCLALVGTATLSTLADTEPPVFPQQNSAGSSTVSLEATPTVSSFVPVTVKNFSDPLPNGATLTGIDLTYSAHDQNWGYTGAASQMFINGTKIGEEIINHDLYPGSQTLTLHYTGALPGYVYGGMNTLSELFDNYPGWSFTFMGGTLTLHYSFSTQNITVNSDQNSCFATLSLPNPQVTDNCGVQSVTSNAPAQFPLGITTVTWTATDNSGNTATTTQTVTVEDKTGPSIGGYSLLLDACASTLPDLTNTANYVSDNCSPASSIVITQSPLAGTPISFNQTITVQLTARDESGNTRTADIIVTRPNTTVTANDDAATVCSGNSVVIDVLNNDTGNCGVMNITSNTAPSIGTLVKNPDNTFTYTAPANYTGPVTFTYSLQSSDAHVFSGNNHYYEFVPAYNMSWNDARTQAAARTYNGLQGYLATVTSAGEQAFITNLLIGKAWMGASDIANEGVWRWVTGPEGLEDGGQGRYFSNQVQIDPVTGITGQGINGSYVNWYPGEPNNYTVDVNTVSPTDIHRPGENYALFYYGYNNEVGVINGYWNDAGNLDGTDNSFVDGYIVEYGGIGNETVGSATVTIMVNPSSAQPVIVSADNQNAICNGAAITLSVANTEETASYQWKLNGTDIQDANAATYAATAAGNYSVVATNATGCSIESVVFSMGVTDPFVVAPFTVQASCFQYNSGFANISVTGGKAPYTYEWTDGTTIISTNSFIGNLAPGTYTLTAHDACGSVSTTSVTITRNPEVVVPAITASGTLAICPETNLVLSFPGIEGYTPVWTRGTNTEYIDNLSTDPNLAVTEYGSYSVYVTDSYGCRNYSNSLYVAPEATTSFRINTHSGPVCNEYQKGFVDLFFTGGIAPYTFDGWKDGAGNFIGTPNQYYVGNLDAGSYTAVAHDACGAAAIAFVQLVNAPPMGPLPVVTASGPFCNNTPVTLTLSPTAYTFTWYKYDEVNHVFIGAIAENQSVITAADAGFYYYPAVKDANGCYGYPQGFSTSSQPLNISVSSTGYYCNQYQKGHANANFSGGISPLSFSWKNADNQEIGTLSYIGLLEIGNYTLTVTDACGTTTTKSFEIVQAPAVTVPTISASGPTSVCLGNTVTLIASQGQTADITYRWLMSNYPQFKDSLSLASTIIADTTGYYNLQTLTKEGCYNSSNGIFVSIANNNLTRPTIAASGSTFVCQGTAVPLSVTNVDPGFTYQWKLNGVIIPGATGSTYAATASGNYSVLADNGAGCTGESYNIIVTVNQNPLAPIINTPSANSTCFPGTIVLAATGGSVNGYTWKNGANTFFGNSYTVNTIGTNVVTVYTTSINGCKSPESAPVTITINAQPSVFGISTPSGSSYCAGSTGISINLSGSQSGVNYELLLNGVGTGNIIAGTGAVISFANITSLGTYSINAVNAATGCSRIMSGSINVTMKASPAVFNVTGSGNLCANSPGGQINISGSETNTFYKKYIDGVYSNTGISGNGSALTLATGSSSLAGTYTFVAQNNSTGCTTNMNGSVVLVPNNLQAPVITASGPTNFCAPGSVVLTSSHAQSYSWSNGANTQSVTANISGAYSVTITDNNGCVANSLVQQVVAILGPDGPGTWIDLGNMFKARLNHTATVLPDGKILLAGGLAVGNINPLSSCEIYDPVAGTFTATGSLNIARDEHRAVLLANGKVLITGGTSATAALNSAELYDPSTGNWALTDTMKTARYRASLVLLPDGKVLLSGGLNSFVSTSTVASAEIFDPATGTWTNTGSMLIPRAYHIGTLLKNGNVLISGGLSGSVRQATSELYNPTTGTFVSTGTMTSVRFLHDAVLLPDGKVLASGGVNTSGALVGAGELYDPAAGTWTATGTMNFPRTRHSTYLLPGGKVLASGGSGVFGSITAELYDPSTGNWQKTATLKLSRVFHAAAILPNGDVLMSGGSSDASAATAELYKTNIPVTISGSSTLCANTTAQLSSNTPGGVWNTMNASVATVDNSLGVVSAVGAGTVSITYTVTNIYGCSHAYEYAVSVNPLPTTTVTASGPTSFNAGGSVTLSADEGFTYLWSNGAVSSSIVVNSSGNYSVALTNANGCTASSTPITVTVNATVAPSIQCPGNISVSADNNGCGAIVNFAATETAGIPASTITYSQNPGTVFPIGTTTVTATATNSAGQSTCTFNITVTDASSPVITQAADINVNNTPGHCGALVTVSTPSATDNCTLASITGARNDGLPLSAEFPAGTTTITWTALDIYENAAYITQKVTVTNTDAIVLTGVPANTTADCDAIPAIAAVTTNSNCGSSASVIGYSFPSNGIHAGITHSYSFQNSSADSKGTASGTNVGAISYATGIMGTAAQFDGSGGYISLGNAGSLSGAGNLAISVWVKTTNPNTQVIINQRNSGTVDGEYMLNIGGSHANVGPIAATLGKVYFMIYNGGFQFELFSNNRVDDGKWHHIVAEREGSIARIFIDGSLSGTTNGGAAASLNNSLGTFIGKDVRDNNKNFIGLIDELKIIATPSVCAYDLERTWLATDASGKQAAAQQILTVADTKAPVLSLPSNITVDAQQGTCGKAVTYNATATDNCSGITISYSIPSGTNFPVGTTNVNVTATDACGNSATGSFAVTVKDVQPPSVTTNNISVTLNTNGTVSITPAQINKLSTDNCAIDTYSLDKSSFDCSNLGVNTVNLTVRDIHGNSTTAPATVTVTDSLAPVPTVSPLPAVSIAPGATVVAPTATDNCAGLMTAVSQNPIAFTTPGTYTINWIYDDQHGNITQQTQTVTVLDNTAPTIVCIPSITTRNDAGVCGAVVKFKMPVVKDNASSVSITVSEGFGDGIVEFNTPVTSDVSNLSFESVNEYQDIAHGHGKSINVTVSLFNPLSNQWIQVQSIETGTDDYHFGGTSINFPAIAAVSKIRFTTSEPIYAGLHLYDLTVNLNSITVVQTGGLPSGSVFPVGTTQNTFIATDHAGNSSTCTFNVTVQDAEKPIVNSVTSIIKNAGANCSWTGSAAVLGILESCSSTVLLSEQDFDENGNNLFNGQSVIPRADYVLPSRSYPIGTNKILITVTDASGNVSDLVTILVKVVDTSKPTITLAGNITQNTDPHVNNAYVKVPIPVVSDNCTVKSIINNKTNTPGATLNYPVGTTVLTWTVTDLSGNQSTATQTITVVDNEAPQIFNVSVDLAIHNDSGSCGAVVRWNEAQAVDNTRLKSFTSDHHPGEVFPIGQTIVNYTAIDSFNNVSTASFIINVSDLEAPRVIARPITISLVNGSKTIQASDIDAGSMDNCGAVSLSLSKSTFTCADPATNIVTLTATDQYGNSSSTTAVVTLIGSKPTSSIVAAAPANAPNTGGVPTELYLGYGAQSVTLTDNVTGTTAATYSWTGGTGLSCTNCASPVFTAAAAGSRTFTATAINQNGCSTTATVSICVRDIRVTPTTNSNVYVCHTDLGTGVSTPISVTVANVANQLAQNPQDKLGACTMAPCSSTNLTASQSVITQGAATAVEEPMTKTLKAVESELKVKASPNPTTDVFTLVVTSDKKLPVQVRIFDAAGRVTESMRNAPIGVPFRMGQTLFSGVYYAEVVQGKERVVVKLIKHSR